MQVFLFFCLLFLSVSGAWSAQKRNCDDKSLNKFKNKAVKEYEDMRNSFFSFRANKGKEAAVNECSNIYQKRIPKVNKDFKKFLSLCNNKNLNQNFEIFTKANLEAIKFICNNDTQVDYEFSIPVALCLGNVQKSLDGCLKKYPLLTIINYTESFCKKANEHFKCVKEILSTPECFGKDVERTLFYGYLKTLYSNTPCGSTK